VQPAVAAAVGKLDAVAVEQAQIGLQGGVAADGEGDVLAPRGR
jgi:hypothetical protein